MCFGVCLISKMLALAGGRMLGYTNRLLLLLVVVQTASRVRRESRTLGMPIAGSSGLSV